MRNAIGYPGRLVFDHLPKSGGTTVTYWLQTVLGEGCVTGNLVGLHKDLIRQYGGSFSVVCGHIDFTGDGLDSRYQYVTCIRDPLDRFLSSLFFNISSRIPGTDELRAQSLKFIQTSGNEVGPLITLNQTAIHFSRIYKTGLHQPEDIYQEAISALSEFEICGFTEKMSSFLECLAKMIGVAPPTSSIRKNIGTSTGHIRELTPELLANIARLNEIDVALYHSIKKERSNLPLPSRSIIRDSAKWAPITLATSDIVSTQSLMIMSLNADIGDYVPCGTIAIFDVIFSLTSSVEKLDCGIQLFDSKGFAVFGTSSTMRGLPLLGLSAGTYEFRFLIKLDLVPGDYRVGFAILDVGNESREVLFRYDHALVFRIYSPIGTKSIGYADLWCETELVSQSKECFKKITDGTGHLTLTNEKSAFSAGLSSLSLRLSNCSSEDWVGTDFHPLTIRYRWTNVLDENLSFEGPHARLPSVIARNTSIELDLEIVPPSESGDYILEISPVQEFNAWLKDIGFDPMRFPVSIPRLQAIGHISQAVAGDDSSGI